MFDLITHYLAGELSQLVTLQFYAALFGIILVDLLLSGDNALVISAITSKLPPAQQRLGIILGSSVAVGLRIALGVLVAFGMMKLPGLALAGGLYLIKVAYDLIKPEDEGDGGHAGASSIWGAIVAIGLVDVSMSLDNVLAIASLANGSYLLLALGVALSIPMVILFSLLISKALARWPALKWIGAMFLAVIAGKVIAHDELVADFFVGVPDGVLTTTFAVAGLVIALGAAWIARLLQAEPKTQW